MTEPTPEPARFGWCTTGQHRTCRARFTSNGKTHRCGCPCHTHEGTTTA